MAAVRRENGFSGRLRHLLRFADCRQRTRRRYTPIRRFAAPALLTAVSPIRFSLNNPFPTAAQGWSTRRSRTTGVQRDLKSGYLQNFSLGIQREIFKDTVVEISYVGSKGTDLLRNRNINQAVLGAGSIASRRPFAGFGNIAYRESSANSIYHSLQARAEKRFSRGFTFLASYTFSKSIDDSSGVPSSAASTNSPQNSFDLRAERALSEFDVRHRFVASFVYELPFGKGKSFLNDGIAAQIFGNFEISAAFSPPKPGDRSRRASARIAATPDNCKTVRISSAIRASKIPTRNYGSIPPLSPLRRRELSAAPDATF